MGTLEEIEQQIAVPGRDTPRIISERPVDSSKSMLVNVLLGVAIFIVGAGAIFFLYPKSPKTASVTPAANPTVTATAQVPVKTTYQNPFDAATQYENPFQQDQNPFSNINQ